MAASCSSGTDRSVCTHVQLRVWGCPMWRRQVLWCVLAVFVQCMKHGHLVAWLVLTAVCWVVMLAVWCAGEEYTASGRPKRKRKNRTRKDKDYVFEGDDEFVDGDGEACFHVSCCCIDVSCCAVSSQPQL